MVLHAWDELQQAQREEADATDRAAMIAGPAGRARREAVAV